MFYRESKHPSYSCSSPGLSSVGMSLGSCKSVRGIKTNVRGEKCCFASRMLCRLRCTSRWGRGCQTAQQKVRDYPKCWKLRRGLEPKHHQPRQRVGWKDAERPCQRQGLDLKEVKSARVSKVLGRQLMVKGMCLVIYIFRFWTEQNAHMLPKDFARVQLCCGQTQSSTSDLEDLLESASGTRSFLSASLSWKGANHFQ